jgi:hypothetical protein
VIRQRSTVEEIVKLGGTPYYDYQVERRRMPKYEVAHSFGQMMLVETGKYKEAACVKGTAVPAEPLWLQRLCGIDCFHRVVHVSLYGCSSTGRDEERWREALPGCTFER